jgi:hypothetical protein
MARSERRAAAVAALLVAFASACNALVGLDTFDKVACAQDCGAGGDAGDAQGDVADGGSDAPGDSSPDSPIIIPIPDGASPTSWARWPMPNPPDGGGLIGTGFSYLSNPDNTVTDQRTNLVWGLTVGAAQGTNFDDALKVCATYGDSGVKWRLPSRIELVTLIDFTRTGPAIDTTHFPIPPGWYWTSSVVRPPTLPYRFWAVDFTSGAVSDSPPNGARNVLCVKGS